MTALVAMLLVPAADVILPPTPTEAQPVGVEQLRFCRDADGERFRGDIDILLLLDDTLTLRTQDKENIRFSVIRNFLEGVTRIETAQRVNVAAYTFGGIVTPVVDFESVTPADIDRVERLIRENNPAQQNTTNFTIALRRASQALNARPAQNCRILLWFTDGNHDEKDDFSPQADVAESQNLRREFCAPDGIADRVRSQRINTFVLLLEPPPSQPRRLEASKDVFQVLTGDPSPNFPDEDQPGRLPTDDCDRPLGEQLGKVFAVAAGGADKLVAIIADFLNELEDGGRITEELCPYPDGAVDSLALPDAHLVDWISATDFSSDAQSAPPAASRLRVISSTGDEYLGDQVLVPYRESGPSVRFRVASEFRDLLVAGWIIRTDEGRDLCLRSRPVDLAFRVSSGEPRLAVVTPAGLPERLWADGQLEFLSLDGRVLSPAEALRSPEVRGRLRVESVEALSSDGTLPARIIIDGAPLRADECSVIAIPAIASIASGSFFRTSPEAPEAALVSSVCGITPATRGDDGGRLDFGALLAELASLRGSERCDVGDDWHVLVDGQRLADPKVQLAVGGDAVRFAIASATAPPNEKRDCIARALPPVELAWQGQILLIPATLTAEWDPRGDVAFASGLTVVALLVALVLSYGLLLLLNWGLLRPPVGRGLRCFSVEAQLEVTTRGDVRVDMPSLPSGDLLKLLATGRGGGSKPLEFIGAPFIFKRRLPLNPVREPVLQMHLGPSIITAVSVPRVRHDIPIDFPDLAILWTTSTLPATSERKIKVTFTIVQSDKVDPRSDFERLSGSIQDLGGRLQERLVEAGSKDVPAAAQVGPRRTEESVEGGRGVRQLEEKPNYGQSSGSRRRNLGSDNSTGDAKRAERTTGSQPTTRSLDD